MTFLDGQVRWRSARIAYLQGDASTRSYARLSDEHGTILLMDTPRHSDGPATLAAQAYSRIAHLAEDMRSFVAMSGLLRSAGLSAPAVPAFDLEKGILLVEDLGDRVFTAEIAAGASQAELWRAAVDVLIRLRGVPLPPSLPLPDGSSYVLPRRDRAAFEIEVRAAARLALAGDQGRAGAGKGARRVHGPVGACDRPPAGAARRLVPARLPFAQPDLAA